jgi:hypothetical protein
LDEPAFAQISHAIAEGANTGQNQFLRMAQGFWIRRNNGLKSHSLNGASDRGQIA